MVDKEARAVRIRGAMRGRPIAWLAEQLGVALSTAHSYLRGTVPPADVAIKIAHILEVDLSWYINGDRLECATSSSLVSVPLVDNHFNVVASVDYTKDLLKSLVEDVHDVRCILQTGVGMRPTIPENAETLFIPMRSQPEDGRIYVLASGGSALIRRVMMSVEGRWKAVCDNPAFRGDESGYIEESCFIGEVIWTSYRP